MSRWPFGIAKSADHAARLLIMSAYLYYRRASPVLSDGDYDAFSKMVAEDFDDLDPARQWQIDSPEAILATGSHVKVTQMAESAACVWHASVHGCAPGGFPIRAAEWKKYKTLAGPVVKWCVAEV